MSTESGSILQTIMKDGLAMRAIDSQKKTYLNHALHRGSFDSTESWKVWLRTSKLLDIYMLLDYHWQFKWWTDLAQCLKEYQILLSTLAAAQDSPSGSNCTDIQPTELNEIEKNFVTSFDETDEFFTPDEEEEGETNLFYFIDGIIS